MICLLSQPARIDKLEPTDPPDYKPRTTSPLTSRGLAAHQMAEVSSMVSNLPQPMTMGAYPDVYGAYTTHQFANPWRSMLPVPHEEEFLGAAIGQKRHRIEESSEFSYLTGTASSTYYSSPSAKISRDMGSRSVEVTRDVSWAPLGAGLDEIVKKATERSPAGGSYQSSPSFTQEYSSDSGKHSDFSKHFSPPRNEGTIPSLPRSLITVSPLFWLPLE